MRSFKEKSLFKFAGKICFLFVIVTMMAVLFCCLMYPYNMWRHFGAYRDKLEALEKISEPKTVFVGGSSALFGFNAEYYEKLSGEKAVNMGLHAVQSPDIYLSCIEPYIKLGDTVVIALEYYAYEDEQAWKAYDYNGLDVAQVSGEYYKVIPSYNREAYFYNQFLRSFGRLSQWLYNQSVIRIAKGTEKVYLRENINAYGDLKPDIAVETQRPEPRNEEFVFSEDAAKYVMDYVLKYREKGANVYIAFAPSYCINVDKQQVEEYYMKFCSYFGNSVLGNPMDWILDDYAAFYDTGYHMTRNMALLHTKYYYDLLNPA